MINERIKRLRGEMAKRGIDMYIVPTSDFHDSEYVGDYFKARKFITGFTGSAGTAIITPDYAGLWTDGRYFVQAAAQLKGSEVVLNKLGEPEVPTEEEFVKAKLPQGGTLAFDGRVVSGEDGENYRRICSRKKGRLVVDEDLVDLIWEDRPARSAEKAWIYDLAYCGKSTADKLAEIREIMKEEDTDQMLVSSLYDIVWILNVRGNDIAYVPVVLSYLVIRKEDCLWFVQEQAVDDEMRAYLAENRVQIRDYDDFYAYVEAISPDEQIWMDRQVANYRLCSSIPAGVEVVNKELPSELMRAIKNPVEIENTIEAHKKDAEAMIEFMHWLKTNVGQIPMTEISIADHLEGLRAAKENFVELSFSTIAGYAEHGAIVHYGATKETNAALRPEGLLLVDSGAQYLEGTTDITRTFALGPVTREMKEDFTRVLQANLALGDASFRYGSTGVTLDILARQPFWSRQTDYNHGTGHGIGHMLNVHEGPQSIRWRNTMGREAAALEEGMITSNEPGFYLEGKYGIRTENEILCRKGVQNSYGQFMYFETITYVPIDKDAIEPSMLSDREKKLLNDYHARVYEIMAPRIAPELREFLQEYTAPIA